MPHQSEQELENALIKQLGRLGFSSVVSDDTTSLDNLIEAKQQQITQAEKWKKGLMQGLFV